MDTVILAGGRGGRVVDEVPLYHKPLLKINGRPNVVNLYDAATAAVPDTRIVIVTAPQNTVSIDDALQRERRSFMVVQREADGPGAALQLAMPYVRTKTVLVLLSDNVVDPEDIHLITRHRYAVSTRRMPREVAAAFTHWDGALHKFVEKEPISSGEADDFIDCWIGPLLLDSECVRTVQLPYTAGEKLIGPYIDSFVPFDSVPTRIGTQCIDIGTTENYRRYLEGKV